MFFQQQQHPALLSHLGVRPLQEQEQVLVHSQAPRASLKGLLLSPLAYKHPTLLSSLGSFIWIFPSCLKSKIQICSSDLHFQSTLAASQEWACPPPCPVPAFDWPRHRKQPNLSALNLTGGILFLEQRKLVWERGRGGGNDRPLSGDPSSSECVRVEREGGGEAACKCRQRLLNFLVIKPECVHACVCVRSRVHTLSQKLLSS